ncbi:hypothetical protein [Arthrobacter sp. MDT1-65]
MSRAQEYRLRSFEAAYVQPLLRFIENDSTNQEEPSGGNLRLLLLREMANWIDMGQWCGYFSSNIQRLSIKHGIHDIREVTQDLNKFDEDRMDLVNCSWVLQDDPRSLSFDGSFGEAIQASMEDLTDERMEFLRLYLFSSSTEWEHAVGEVAVVAEEVALGRRRIPQRMMDRVTWAFHGPESELRLESVALPSDWRVAPIYEICSDNRRELQLEFYRAKIVDHFILDLVNPISSAKSESMVGEQAYERGSLEFAASGSHDMDNMGLAVDVSNDGDEQTAWS